MTSLVINCVDVNLQHVENFSVTILKPQINCKSVVYFTGAKPRSNRLSVSEISDVDFYQLQ